MMALEGIRVLDMTLLQQGPSATTYLADMGAEVIKIEDLVRGDPGRGIQSLLGSMMNGVATHGINYYFEAHNRNKKGIALNLKTQGGRQAFYRLVEKSDVLAFNYRRETMKGLGLDYETLSRINPRLIYACGSGYGPVGPDAHKPAVDGIGQARSGLISLVTEPERPPADAGVGTVDQVSGLFLAFGILCALVARQQTGKGQEVDSSLLGGAISIQSMWLQSYLLSGTLPSKVPRERARSAFWNSYRGSDGQWFLICQVNPAEVWDGFCQELGILQVRDDPRFATQETRLANGEALVAILDRVFATAPAAQWVARLQPLGVICDLVYTYADVSQDPQVWGNDYLVKVDHPVAGRIKMLGLPVRLSQTPGSVRSGAPLLGQHTEEVLLEVAGYTWDEIAQLKEEGAII